LRVKRDSALGSSNIIEGSRMGDKIFAVNDKGYVGIGLGSPAAPLHFSGTAGNKISLRSSYAAPFVLGDVLFFGFGLQPSVLQVTVPTKDDAIVFGRGDQGKIDWETMRFKGNGQVRIGFRNETDYSNWNDSLTGLVTVKGTARPFKDSIAATGGVLRWWGTGPESNGYGGAVTRPPLSTWHPATAVLVDQYINSGGPLDAQSDSRAKTILGISDSSNDLSTLMNIEITDYRHIDKPVFGDSSQKKVIAQQVRKTFPQAVEARKGVVPDIFRTAVVAGMWVQVANNLRVGDRVRIMHGSSEGIYDVLEATPDKFRVSLPTPTQNAFVYGREVSDLLSVDYQAIAMLAISATQQVEREKRAEYAALRESVAKLRAANDSAKARLAVLERIESQREAQVAAFGQLMSVRQTAGAPSAPPVDHSSQD